MKIHFIGIGRISMSALGEICLNKGYEVSGSDMSESSMTNKLQSQGAKIYIGQRKENIVDGLDMVVYTAAIHPDNEELMAAKEKNILTINRAAFLGQIMREYKNSIAVAGTHGKTTTTSMLSTIFDSTNLDPTILVGGNLKSIGGNVKIGNSQNFITEACEYTDSFLNFNPKIAIVLNIEEDHLDYFSGIEEIKASFNKFGKLLPRDGHFVINGDSANTEGILHDVKATVIKYGKESTNDVIIKNIYFNDHGFGSFDLTYFGKDLGNFQLSVPGVHNIYNATSAIIVSIVSGISIEDIKSGITKYTGVGRRFETKGTYNGALVVDDYAHHPTEIATTLKAARQTQPKRLICAFQPHRYSRTQLLQKEYGSCFKAADLLILTDVYSAGEDPIPGVNGELLVQEVTKQTGQQVVYVQDKNEIAGYLKSIAQEGDLIMTMGAGDIVKCGEELVGLMGL